MLIISVSHSISSQILDALLGAKKGAATSGSTLKDRVFKVHRLLGKGEEPHEIARTLHLSIKTVDTHRSHIRLKRSLRNATELIHHVTRWTTEQG